MTDPYASAEESAAVLRPATEDEKWLHEQLDRIDPHRLEMGSAGEVPALIKLVFELREQVKVFEEKEAQKDPDHIDPTTHIEMLKSWLLEADVSCDALSKHLDNVIEIAKTWQPDYATKMDLETIRLAKERLPAQPTSKLLQTSTPH